MAQKKPIEVSKIRDYINKEISRNVPKKKIKDALVAVGYNPGFIDKQIKEAYSISSRLKEKESGKLELALLLAVLFLFFMFFLSYFLHTAENSSFSLNSTYDLVSFKEASKEAGQKAQKACIANSVFKLVSGKLMFIEDCKNLQCSEGKCIGNASGASSLNNSNNNSCKPSYDACTYTKCISGRPIPFSYGLPIDRNQDCIDDCSGSKIDGCKITPTDKDGDGIADNRDICEEQFSRFAYGCDIFELKQHGKRTKKELFIEKAKKAENKLDKKGITFLESSGAIPKYDYIKARYYYESVSCEDILKDISSKIPQLKIEKIVNATKLSLKEKEYIYTNWANHWQNESIVGFRLKFPMLLLYGPGKKEYNGIEEPFNEIEEKSSFKIKGKAPGYVTVLSEETTCCYSCIMFAVCFTLKDPPAICEDYLNKKLNRKGIGIAFSYNGSYEIPVYS